VSLRLRPGGTALASRAARVPAAVATGPVRASPSGIVVKQTPADELTRESVSPGTWRCSAVNRRPFSSVAPANPVGAAAAISGAGNGGIGVSSGRVSETALAAVGVAGGGPIS
jgi:hypothetical protein